MDSLLRSTAATFLRVVIAVALASLWTIPVGVLIGDHRRWLRLFQPVIQMAASVPAPMLFPVVVGVLLAFGVGLGISSVVLLLLGTEEYILFNVIAGTVVAWARYAALFKYSSTRRVFHGFQHPAGTS